jgi:hypothetical protein
MRTKENIDHGETEIWTALLDGEVPPPDKLLMVDII